MSVSADRIAAARIRFAEILQLFKSEINDTQEAVFQSAALQRIAAHGDEKLLVHLAFYVAQRRTLTESGSITPESLRQESNERQALEEDVMTTVRMMSRFAAAIAHKSALKFSGTDILAIANFLEFYYLGFGGPRHEDIAPLIGQKFDPRAYFIRYLNSCVPLETEKRLASIAELVRMGGYPDTSDQLVRSTLMKGLT